MVDRCFDRCMVGSDRGGRSYLAHGLPALRRRPRALPRHYRSRPYLVVGIIQTQTWVPRTHVLNCGEASGFENFVQPRRSTLLPTTNVEMCTWHQPKTLDTRGDNVCGRRGVFQSGAWHVYQIAMDRRRNLTEWVGLPQPAWFIDSPRLDTRAAHRRSSAGK